MDFSSPISGDVTLYAVYRKQILKYAPNADKSSYTVTGFAGDRVPNVVIPSEYKGLPVTGIGADAFPDHIVSVEIPITVKNIGRDAFFKCNTLKQVKIFDFGAWCGISFENQYSNPLLISTGRFVLNPRVSLLNGEEVVNALIPDGTTKIGTYVFSGRSSIETVTIPASVTTIETNAFLFFGDNLHRTVRVPASVTRVEKAAFFGNNEFNRLCGKPK